MVVTAPELVGVPRGKEANTTFPLSNSSRVPLAKLVAEDAAAAVAKAVKAVAEKVIVGSVTGLF